MKPYPLKSVLLLVLLCVFSGLRSQPKETVLLVSFDGFRSDYTARYNLPNFKAFAAAGTASEGIIPCFPSLTFPNHYSIVTGMYPGTHGLVDNNFYDSLTGVQYGMRNRPAVEDAQYYGGIPLWTLARRAGIRTASYYWVGSEVKDRTKGPDTYFIYNEDVRFETQIDSVHAWLRLPEKKRPGFITLYFSEPDHISHASGPHAEPTQKIILRMDSLLGYLMKGIASSGASVNTILVSDHGMSELTAEDATYIFLDELYDVKSPKIKTVSGSTLAHLYIDQQKTLDSMYQLLKGREKEFKVYKRRDLPERWHYNHFRIGDLVIVPSPYHCIRFANRDGVKGSVTRGSKFGVHGYDPSVVKDMHGLFMAQGPRIKKGKKVGLVRNIDIYPLVTKILGLPLPKIDGDPKALQGIYVKP